MTSALADTLAGAHPPVLARRAFVDQVMGMPVSVHVRAVDTSRSDVEAAAARVFAHLRRVDAVLSTWRADSDLLRIQHGEIGEVDGVDEVHPWLAEVTDLCLEAEDRTDGFFRAWRRRPGGRLSFDPTGLVKGWAVAAAAEHLRIAPEIAYSIGAGGDVVVGTGTGVDQAPPWRIGIEDPRQRGGLARVVTVTQGAVATSGAAIRGGHVVDPRTGRGIVRAGSATVVGPDLMWADVWATAAWVDPQRARALIEERDPAYDLIVI
ncbi:FAD:protein FMN transferase [Ornithinibacter aureus]|uniref:FAD:protein FMN transferase n=1 Tax=Ornithinibacter aureus TaxID=622664 RepID=A0ABP8K381_9MICO|nr:FAD:protein FMN transferase [Ornithinibacter aureus]KAF0833269.1 thiamine biosynthesis lipoprotein [Ornithinibacter aureus]